VGDTFFDHEIPPETGLRIPNISPYCRAQFLPSTACTHLRGFETLPELQKGLEDFMSWYNDERIHSSLEYHVPSDVYSGAVVLAR
jgi:transposase InsO family protein